MTSLRTDPKITAAPCRPQTATPRRVLGHWALLAGLFVSVGCGARSTSNNVGNGSNTNWLSGCETTSDCGGTGICANGACTPSCSDSSDCAGLGNDAQCGSAVRFVEAPSDRCDLAEEQRVCAPTCERDSNCERIGDGYTCESGVCAPAACQGSVYDPCDGKACGDACTLCDPTDSTCEETLSEKYCGANGTCGGGMPECPADCASVPLEACEESGCYAISGVPLNSCAPESTVLGCTDRDGGDAAITCATHPDSGSCYEFTTTTIPAGWSTTDCNGVDCAPPSCPQVTPECFSPTLNVEQAYLGTLPGCACQDGNSSVCVGGAGLTCYGGNWVAVEDGPCYPVTTPCDGVTTDVVACIGAYRECVQVEDMFCGRNSKSGECPDGVLTTSEEGCLTLAPACEELSSGMWCAPFDSVCPKYHRLATDCFGPDYACLEGPEAFYCALTIMDTAACADEGGVVYSDPGDGSLMAAGCPEPGQTPIGLMSGFEEGGLCCLPAPTDGGTPDSG